MVQTLDESVLRRKKEPETPDPRAFERFEKLARQVVRPAKARPRKRGGDAKKQ